MKAFVPAVLLMLAAPAFAIVGGEERALLLCDKRFHPEAGTRSVQKSLMTMRTKALVFKVAGQEIQGEMDGRNRELREVEVLAKEKMRSVLKESVDVKGLTVNGEMQPEDEEKHPLLGVAVISEKIDDEWKVRLEEGEPTEAQMEELEKLEEEMAHDEDEAMYGTRPRLVGERWEVDASLIPGFDDGEITGKMTLEIAGEREFEGQHCAEIKGTMDAVMTMEEEGQKLTMKIKGKVLVYRSLEQFTDVKYEVTGEMELKATFAGEGVPVQMEGKGPIGISGLQSIKPPVRKR